MRITGGVLKGRRLVPPPAGVRPTKDFVREALFSILAGRVDGELFIDLFAGTGAVGLGALSRGAAKVYGVESSRSSLKVLRANVHSLSAEDYSVVQSDAVRFLERYAGEKPASVIFADPPYEKKGEDAGWACRLLSAVEKSGCLLDGGVLVLEQSSDTVLAESEGWVLFDRRVYGKTALGFYASA